MAYVLVFADTKIRDMISHRSAQHMAPVHSTLVWYISWETYWPNVRTQFQTFRSTWQNGSHETNDVTHVFSLHERFGCLLSKSTDFSNQQYIRRTPHGITGQKLVNYKIEDILYTDVLYCTTLHISISFFQNELYSKNLIRILCIKKGSILIS